MMKEIGLRYGLNEIFLMVPDNSIIYHSNYPVVSDTPAELHICFLFKTSGNSRCILGF